MDNFKLEKEGVLKDFISETYEKLDLIEQHIILLESKENLDGDAKIFTTLFETFSSIQKGAKWLGLTNVIRIAERSAQFFKETINKNDLSPQIVEVGLQTKDTLLTLINSLKNNKSIEEIDISKTLSLLDYHLQNLKTKNPEGSDKNISFTDISDLCPGQTILKSHLWNFSQNFILAIEKKDPHLTGKSYRVIQNSLIISDELISGEQKLDSMWAGLLYDLGMFIFPYSTVLKKNTITGQEAEMLKEHPKVISEPLRKIEGMEPVALIIDHHHERFDGTGYPNGLKGDEIPIQSRILSIVDAFNAMMSERSYRSKLSVMVVKKEINDHAGTQFDPALVEIFNQRLEEEKIVF